MGFFDFFETIHIPLGKASAKFNEFKTLLQAGHYDMCVFEKLVVVCKKSEVIHKNAQGRMHCVNGPAIHWKDGYELFYVQGRALSKTNFDKVCDGKYTIDDFTKEPNEEVKSACIALMQEKFGDEYLFRFFNQFLKEVDTYVDKKDAKYLLGTTGGMNIGVYTLFKGEVNDVEVAYVRVFCPSSDRMFYLGVDNSNTTAREAIASLCVLPAKMLEHLKGIRRQGERYSTTYTPMGWKVFSTLSPEDISNLIHLDGETYFNKMQYEY